MVSAAVSEIVLITGGSGGIGEHMTRRLSSSGATVVVVDLQPFKEPLPPRTSFYELDITDKSAVREVASAIRRDVGEPTVLLLNAGVAAGKPILSETDEETQRCFDVNCVSLFTLTREFLPAMLDKKSGHVVVIASLASFVSVSNLVDYCSTKAAALSFYEGLKQELKHNYHAPNVKTSVFHPSWVRTPILSGLMKSDFADPVLEPEHVAGQIVNHILAGKEGQVFIPGRLSMISMIRGFPVFLQERIRDRKAGLVDETRG